MLKFRSLAAMVLAGSLFAAVPASAQDRVVIDEAPSADKFAEMLFGAPPPAGIKYRGIVMHTAQASGTAGETISASAHPGMASDAPTLSAIAPSDSPKIVAAPVKFAFNSADVPADFKPTLESLAQALTRPEAQGKTLIISGHTDPLGPADYNASLSKARAAAVADFLVERGVPSERLVTVGLGESKLLSPDNNRLNRRVEFAAR